MTGPMAGGCVKVKLWAGFLTGIMIPLGLDAGVVLLKSTGEWTKSA